MKKPIFLLPALLLIFGCSDHYTINKYSLPTEATLGNVVYEGTINYVPKNIDEVRSSMLLWFYEKGYEITNNVSEKNNSYITGSGSFKYAMKKLGNDSRTARFKILIVITEKDIKYKIFEIGIIRRSLNFYYSDPKFDKEFFYAYPRIDTEVQNIIKSLTVAMSSSQQAILNTNVSTPAQKTEPLSIGTGFAISADGHIATCYSLVEGATSITIRGVYGCQVNTFNAVIVADDKNNDLAILKIDDKKFNSIKDLPYGAMSSKSTKGEAVFILSYPTAGEKEPKLTNGKVTSISDLTGEPSGMQFSEKIFAGSRGAPLFDKYGNLMGIVNVSNGELFIIKPLHLETLIDQMHEKPKLPTQNLLVGKTLTEQVKQISSYIYIIEVRYAE